MKPMILDSNQNHAKAKDAEVINALTASAGEGGGHIPMVVEPIGVDLYNQSTTGSVAKALNSIATDSDHVPCVIEPIGFDSYNLQLTGTIGRTMATAGGGLNEHIPVVIEPIIFTPDTYMKIDNGGGA